MKNLLTLMIILLNISYFTQEKKCSEFKTGEFRYVKDNMPEIIVRTESMQIETNPNDNIVVKTKIQWTSECEYVLIYSEILNHPKDVRSMIGKKIYCEIIDTNGNRVKVHAKSDTIDEVIEFIKVD